MQYPLDFQKIVQLDKNLYSVMCPLRLAGAPFGRRMVIIVSHGEVMLQSAFAPDEAMQQEIEKLGKVTSIVVPTYFHDTFLDEVSALYPKATYYCVKGSSQHLKNVEKVESMQQLAETHWMESLSLLPLGGIPKANECVFYHKPSRILLVSDLFFNIGELEGWWLRTLAKLLGFADAPMPSRLFCALIKDKAAFTESLSRILELDFEIIIPSHFLPIEKEGKAVIKTIRDRFCS